MARSDKQHSVKQDRNEAGSPTHGTGDASARPRSRLPLAPPLGRWLSRLSRGLSYKSLSARNPRWFFLWSRPCAGAATGSTRLSSASCARPSTGVAPRRAAPDLVRHAGARGARSEPRADPPSTRGVDASGLIAHLVDRVPPQVPVRPWTIARGQRRAVRFVQRFGDALTLNVHLSRRL